MQIFTPAALTLSAQVSKFTATAGKDVSAEDIRKLAVTIINQRGTWKAFQGLLAEIKAERARLVGSAE